LKSKNPLLRWMRQRVSFVNKVTSEHSFRFHWFALLLYSALAIGMTLPLALQMSDHLLGTDSNALNDTFFSVWIFGWQAHQLIADPVNLFQGNIFFPFQNTLAFSEIILPGALWYLPLAYATQNPVLAYNLVVLASFPLNGFAMYLYALDWLATTDREQRLPSAPSPRAWRHTRYAALLAGIIFAFCTYKMGELRHVQLLMAMFMPLTLLYVARWARRPNLRNSLLTALFFSLNALSSLYYAVFLAFAILLYVIVDFALRRYRLTRAHLAFGALAALSAAALVAPFVLPLLQIERQYNFSAGRNPRLFSARPYSYLAAPASQWLYGNLTRAFYVASKGQPLFPGLAATALSILGAVALMARKNRAWIFPVLLAALGFILSFGPDLILGRTTVAALPFSLPYEYLARIVTPLKGLNAPSRFVVLSMLALGLLAAYGARAWMQRAPRWASWITAACALTLVLEYIPAPLRLTPVEAGANVSPLYAYLAQQPRGEAIVHIPMGAPTFADQDKYVAYTYSALYHPYQPIVNGYSTFIPPDYYALVRDMQDFPTRRKINRLQAFWRFVVVSHTLIVSRQ
ncbi:MAG: hypothetical protein DCC52_15720, partial [Chloroflexi bacterium]